MSGQSTLGEAAQDTNTFYRRTLHVLSDAGVPFLVGGSHVNNTVSGPGGLTYTDLAFSMKAGGGVDFNLSPHFAVRVFDADYYRTSLFSAHQNNIWLSTGFVIRLGGARPE